MCSRFPVFLLRLDRVCARTPSPPRPTASGSAGFLGMLFDARMCSRDGRGVKVVQGADAAAMHGVLVEGCVCV